MIHSTDTIRRRPDGSIDTAFYIARGRTRRSAELLNLPWWVLETEQRVKGQSAEADLAIGELPHEFAAF